MKATVCKLAGSSSRGRYTACSWIPLGLVLALKTILLAQTATGRIAGLLVDPSGAIVSGGEIEIRNLDSGLTKSAVTDREGRYVFDAVPVGRYRVSGTAPRFDVSMRDDITVAAGHETDLRLELAIGRSVTAIGVTAWRQRRKPKPSFPPGPEPTIRRR